jgi:chromosome segregation ATPase
MEYLFGSLAAVMIEFDTWQVAAIAATVLGAILALCGAIAILARALGKAGQTNSALNDTLMRLNNELQSTSDSRIKHDAEHDTERLRWVHEREALSKRVNEQDDLIEKNKRAARDADELHTKLLNDVQKELRSAVDCQATLEKRIDELTAQIQQKDEQITALTARIDDLEKENGTLKGERELMVTRVADLTQEREQLRARIEKMQGEIDALNRRENGTLHTESGETIQSVDEKSDGAAAEAADSAQGEQTS